jgi:cobalt-zinc-cadmium efflux system outer membrane protein
LNDVRVGYYEVLLAQKTIELNEELVRIGQEGVKATETLLEQMEVSKVDVLQASIEADTAKLSLIQARNRHVAAWRRLAAVLGRPEMTPARLEGNAEENLPTFRWEDALQTLLAQSPELAEARANAGRADYELSLQFAERIPNFEIGAAVKYESITDTTIADVAVDIPLPLYNRNQGNIHKAEAELIAAEQNVRRLELNLRDRLAAVFEQYANARREVEIYIDTILPNATTSLEMIRRGYEEGEFNYLTLLTAQRTFFNVSLNYLSSLSALWAASVELEGMLLRGGLEPVE